MCDVHVVCVGFVDVKTRENSVGAPLQIWLHA
jgi:hypothetical protein